jgi:hypothetical protein
VNVAVSVGVVAVVAVRRSCTSGRVEGLTCHSYRPDAGTVIVEVSRSPNARGSPVAPVESTTGEVGVANRFSSRSLAPAGALPATTECIAGSTLFSSATR